MRVLRNVLIVLICVYAITPFVAGLLHTSDRRGPRIFSEPHHELLYMIGYYLAGHHRHDGKPRIPFTQRVWFYGMPPEKLLEPEPPGQ